LHLPSENSIVLYSILGFDLFSSEERRTQKQTGWFVEPFLDMDEIEWSSVWCAVVRCGGGFTGFSTITGTVLQFFGRPFSFLYFSLHH
jgi:hypothetical protein